MIAVCSALGHEKGMITDIGSVIVKLRKNTASIPFSKVVI